MTTHLIDLPLHATAIEIITEDESGISSRAASITIRVNGLAYTFKIHQVYEQGADGGLYKCNKWERVV